MVGLGSGVVPPAIFNITANRVSQVQKDFSFGVVTSCIHLGAFLTPFFQLALSKIGNDYSIRYSFMSTGIVLIVASAIALGNGISTRSQGSRVPQASRGDPLVRVRRGTRGSDGNGEILLMIKTGETPVNNLAGAAVMFEKKVQCDNI